MADEERPRNAGIDCRKDGHNSEIHLFLMVCKGGETANDGQYFVFLWDAARFGNATDDEQLTLDNAV
jgi:hypothetical protein